MKRIVIMLLAVTLCLCACGGNKTVDLKEVKDKIVTDLKIESPLEFDAEWLKNTYGIGEESVRSFVCLVTMKPIFPDEIVMIEAVDSQAAKTVSTKLEQRLSDLIAQAQNYDAESLALLKKCKVQTVGNYVTLFISAKGAEMQRIFEQAAK